MQLFYLKSQISNLKTALETGYFSTRHTYNVNARAASRYCLAGCNGPVSKKRSTLRFPSLRSGNDMGVERSRSEPTEQTE